MRSLLLALALASLSACYDDCDDCDYDPPDPAPVFLEVEPNDDPLTANDFGLLIPGDRFWIDGSVRDDLADPFDGFAFTASEPLHVDFQLFSGNAAADLDVCLYDPAIDQTVGCFATGNSPEQGGVDVFAGGLDFHLVIESFVGDATYSLEIVVLPLMGAIERSVAGVSSERGLAATGARAEHGVAAELEYRKPSKVSRPVVEIEERLEIAPDGTILSIVRVRSEGNLGE